MNKFNNLPYRKGVGMMVFNDQKKIFVGKRIDNQEARVVFNKISWTR